MAMCLDQVANLKCSKTTDSTNALRYLEYGIDYQAKWSKQLKGTPIKVKPLAEHHGIYMRASLGSVSSDAVSFHLVNGTQPIWNATKADTLRRVHAILRGSCKSLWDTHPVALDGDGNAGYVHDPTYLRKHPLSFTYHPLGDAENVCKIPLGEGVEGEMGYQGLQKIRVMPESSSSPRKKVLCLIYTHSGRHDRVRAIAETFGPRCDGFMAASNVTDPSIGAVNLLHEGPESYDNIWLKVRAMWQYVHDHYLDEYDYFHIGGDDHFVIPENLRYVASTGSWKGPWQQSKPLFLGGNMIDFPHTNVRYCGGGSGYTLNRIALSGLIENMFDSYQCRPHFESSEEDRIMSSCFRSVGINCMDTNDDKNETRYHQASVNFHASWKKGFPSVWRADSLEQFHGIKSKDGLGQISETSVSFHLKGRLKGVQDRGIRRYFAILYGQCNSDKQSTS
jgi:glycoprotein-N-acetylgalactosamine 3-beta-galactosyltransferase